MTVSTDSPQVPRRDHGHWHEYRLTWSTGLAYALGPVTVACGIGLGAYFLGGLLVGLLAEEGLLLGYSGATAIVEQSFMEGSAFALGLGYLCATGAVLAHSWRSVGVSRDLVRAARHGADPMAAPHPVQVEQVVVPPHVPATVLGAVHVGFGALVLAFAVPAGDTTASVVSALAVVGGVAGLLLVRASRPAHRRRREQIAAHWSAHAEQSAWGHYRKAAKAAQAGTGSSDPDGDPDSDPDRRTRRGLMLLLLAAGLGVLCGLSFQAWIFVRNPGTVATPGATVNDRADYSSGVESILDGALWLSVGLGLAGLVVGAAGAALFSAGRAAERRDLVRRLDDPAAPRPHETLLRRHAERGPSELGLLAALLGAFVLAPALGTLRLATTPGIFSDSLELFAGLRTEATVAAVAGVVLILAGLVATLVGARRGYELRERLQERWPILPATKFVRSGDKTVDRDAKKTPRYLARTRPTLRHDKI